MGSDISKLVEAINRVGIQNVSLLSRLAGMPKETIRYMLRKTFPELGLRTDVVIDYAKLGLERYFAMLKFNPNALDQASELLHRLAKVAFLTYRCGLAFEPWHIAMFAVPVSVFEQFQAFLNRIEGLGILTSVRTERLEWDRRPELKSKYHDFASRTWTVDWDRVNAQFEPSPAPLPVHEPMASPEIDGTDVLIAKELELDSRRNFTEIARKLAINDRTLRWHYANHVSPMITSHYVRWLPAGPNQEVKIIGLLCEFNDLSRSRLAKIRNLFNKFPFTWYEGGRKDGYYQAHSGIPAEHLISSLRFLNKNLREVVSEWRTHALDLSTSYWYEIPYENFKEDGWFFDKQKALNSVRIERARVKNIGAGP